MTLWRGVFKIGIFFNVALLDSMCNLLIILLIWECFFHWSLSDNKFLQVHRSISNISADRSSLDGLHSSSYFQVLPSFY